MKRSLFVQRVEQSIGLDRRFVRVIFLVCGLGVLGGCRSPSEHRQKADEVAKEIIAAKQEEALGKTEPFGIERPSDILRRRLLEEQGLAYSSEASLGTDKLEPVVHWPEEGYPPSASSPDANIPIEPNKPLKLSLIDVLQIGARNSSGYQSTKEQVFRVALDLDLRRNDFRNIFSGGVSSDFSSNTSGDNTVTTVNTRGDVGVTRTLKNGMVLSAGLMSYVLNVLTQGGTSRLGLGGDATVVSWPLLRGAGRHIVTEGLTRAERDVVYEIWGFERYKRTFAVGIAQEYFSVLSQMDRVANARDNYRSAITSARWSRRRADAGRIPEIEVDQAVQAELRGRSTWISSQEGLKSSLDRFKNQIGLPPDALVELDPNDLVQLRGRAAEILEQMRATSRRVVSETAPSADAPVELVPASYEDAGPLEIDESLAIQLALENRLDLQEQIGRVYDAQRNVVVMADALRAGLSVDGSVSFDEDDDDGSLGIDGGVYRAGLVLDLPFERTRERNEYRKSLISLEQATRNVQDLEDQIKLSIRSLLRTLLESREGLKIQAQSVVVAEKRVRSSNLFLEAGRIQIRDLLEAQDALLAAQNDLTTAIVDYRLAELQLQRDMGLLEVDEQGLWQEFSPEEIDHDS